MGVIGLFIIAAVFLATFNAPGPAAVTEVPATLSGQGVEIDNTVVLTPLKVVPAHAITATEAIRAARPYAKRLTAIPPAALEASVTVHSSRPIANLPAWVVTFTSRKPFNVRGVRVSHFSAVLNATTGKFVFGFFTK